MFLDRKTIYVGMQGTCKKICVSDVSLWLLVIATSGQGLADGDMFLPKSWRGEHISVHKNTVKLFTITNTWFTLHKCLIIMVHGVLSIKLLSRIPHKY